MSRPDPEARHLSLFRRNPLTRGRAGRQCGRRDSLLELVHLDQYVMSPKPLHVPSLFASPTLPFCPPPFHGSSVLLHRQKTLHHYALGRLRTDFLPQKSRLFRHLLGDCRDLCNLNRTDLTPSLQDLT